MMLSQLLIVSIGELNVYADPTQGYTTGDAEAVAFLKAHPELAKKAATTGVNYAKENPDVVRGAMTSAAANPQLRATAIDVARDNPDLVFQAAYGSRR